LGAREDNMEFRKDVVGTFEQITANLMPVVFNQAVSQRELETLPQCELSSRIDYVLGGMILSLKTYVAGNQTHVETIKHVRWPRDWKEALKERFAPKWYLETHPVEYSYAPVQIQHVHMCPHLLVGEAVDPKRKHLEWLTYTVNNESR
jgi:hypothetical protein